VRPERGISSKTERKKLVTTTHAYDPAIATTAGYPTVVYYHHVHPRLQHYTALTPGDFARSLDVLLEELAVCDPTELWNGDGLRLPERASCLLTFDDGYLDTWEYALPELEARNLRAIFFIVTGLVGQRSSDGDPTRNYLDWEQCAELVSRGHVIGSHGVHHRPITDLSSRRAEAEVRTSIAEISARLGAACRLYSYPYGFVPETTVCPADVWAFGTVKAPVRPWIAQPHNIRRTYLPTGHPAEWPGLVRGWRLQWAAGDGGDTTGSRP
jgi:peptidoglycan/xylan/chitin deacetylase (PgdA/CDA1 family)